MEVNGLTASTIPQFNNHPIHVDESINSVEQDHSVSLPRKNGKKLIESVTMDLDDMKNFLFMMIRGGSVLIESEENKIGRIVNKFA